MKLKIKPTEKMKSKIDHTTPDTITSITVKHPTMNPYNGDWGYVKLDYPIENFKYSARNLEVVLDPDTGQACLVGFGGGGNFNVPIKIRGLDEYLEFNK